MCACVYVIAITPPECNDYYVNAHVFQSVDMCFYSVKSLILSLHVHVQTEKYAADQTKEFSFYHFIQ